MLAGQVAPLAFAATHGTQRAPSSPPVSARSSKAAPQPVPVFAAPNITATKVDSWDDTATPDGKAEPGQTITYTVTITNTGDADATGVTFTDSVDTNTTLVPGSVQTQPIAVPDTYNVIGNVRIAPNAAQGLLANDRDPDTGNNSTLTASGPTTSTQGGNVAISADGSFTYNPPVGFAGTDTFTYTVRDTGPDTIAGNSDDKTDTATATFNVGNGTATPGTNVIWFVNPSAPSGGDGRLTNPFNCYTGASASCFSQTAADDPGDAIFLFTGAITGGNTLLNNQKLIGAGASDTLANLAAVTVQAYSDALPTTGGAAPSITTTNANAIPLGQNNLLRGFTVGATGTGSKISGSNFGTLTVGNNTTPDVSLSGAGQALNLSTGTFAATSAFSSVATTSSNAAPGINLATVGGTVSFGATTVSGSGTQGINISGSSVAATFGVTSVSSPTTQGILIGTTTGNIIFGNTTITGGTDGVSFQNNSAGTRTFGTLGVSGGSGNAFLHGAGGGNVTVNGAATLSSTNDPIEIANAGNGTAINFAGGATVTKTSTGGEGVHWSGTNTGATLTFATLALTTSNGTGMNLAGGGTINVTTAAGSSINATGTGTQVAPAITASGVALGMNFTTVSATGGGSGTGQGITLATVTGSLSISNGASTATNIQNTGGAGISVTSSSATLSFGNTTVNSTGGTGIILGGSGTGNSGAITFGAITVTPDSGQRGILAQQNITGGITTTSGTVTTTNATAVEMTGVSAASRTPLNIQLTTVNTTGGATAANGIMLQNTSATGSPGGFRVLGNGGACDAATTTCTGGRITNTTGADGATGGNGVYLNTVDKVVLTRMHLDAHVNFAVRGFTVTGFTMDTCLVDGTNGNNAAVFEGSVVFDQLLGTAAGSNANSITSSTIKGGWGDNLRVSNTSGTGELTVSSTTIRDTNTGTNGNDNLAINAHTTANLTVHVTNCTFAATNGDHIQTVTDGQATLSIVIGGTAGTGNTFSGGGGVNALGQGITISGGDVTGGVDSTETVRFNVSNNTLNGTIQGGAININEGVGNGNWQGQVANNVIGTAASNGSGASQSAGIRVENHAKGTLTAIVSGNTVRQWSTQGINLQAGDTSATGLTNGPLNVTVSGNTITNPNPASSGDHGIQLNVGTQINNNNIVCADIKNNDSLGNAANGGVDYRLRQRMLTTIRMPGYSGANNDNAAVRTYILGRPNTAHQAAGADVAAANNVAGGGGGYTNTPGGAQCTQPTVPTGPAPVAGGASRSRSNITLAETQSPTTSTTVNNDNNVTSRPFVLARPTTTAAPARTTTTAAAPTRNTSAPATSGSTTANRELTPVIDGAGGTVTVNIGTLAPNDSVTITFQVVIDNPYTGGPNVSNQGTVSGSNFSNVLTDDPDIAGTNNPTLTPINAAQIKINDAKEPEPTSGTSQMLFTLTSSTPAGASGITVNYATASGGGNPATGGASCDGTNDYITTSGTATIPNGSKTVTIPVTICSDANVETDETLLLNISSPSTGTIIDPQATGTITANTAGTFVISEFRHRGSSLTTDEFVELYNNTNSPLTVAASDASAGYGLYKMGATCNDTPVLVGTIPNGTVIPARGHYLVVGTGYSLANYGGTGAAAGNLTLTSELEDDRNIAVFSTANIDNISSANRLDAVGFNSNTGNVCNLMHEGTALAPVGANVNGTEYSYFRKECDFVPGVGCQASGNPKDTNNNSTDFMFADVQGTFISGVEQHLGAPGPENLASPIRRDDAGVLVPLLDSTKSSSADPNRFRDFVNAGSSAPNGTLYVRRRIQNTTGATITKMRFRIIEMTTFPSPGVGTADFRLRTSTSVVISGINDPATCASTGTPTTVPCQVTAQATVLETPPAQPNGGGYNSTVSVSIPGGLANNASIDVNFALGVVQGGTFRFYIIVEALP